MADDPREIRLVLKERDRIKTELDRTRVELRDVRRVADTVHQAHASKEQAILREKKATEGKRAALAKAGEIERELGKEKSLRHQAEEDVAALQAQIKKFEDTEARAAAADEALHYANSTVSTKDQEIESLRKEVSRLKVFEGILQDAVMLVGRVKRVL